MGVDSKYILFSTFPTPQDAQRAAETLKEADSKIHAWHEAHEGERTGALDEVPTPVEIELAQKYQLDWRKNWGSFSCHTFETAIFERLLIVHAEEYGWNPNHRAWEHLIARLGGMAIVQQAVIDESEIAAIDVRLTCTATDEQTAERVYEESKRYLQLPPDWETRMIEEDWDEEQEAAFFNTAPWFGFEDDRLVDGSVTREGERKISFNVHIRNIESQFVQCVEQLQALGFSEIDYTFTQADDSELEE